MATRWRIKSTELQQQQCNNIINQTLLDTLGNGYSQITPLDEQLDLIETRYTTSRDFSILNRFDSGQSRLVLTLSMHGSSRYVGNEGTAIEFNQGYTSITSFNVSNGERQYQGDRNIHQLRFVIGKDWLTRHYSKEQIAKLFSSKAVQSLSYRPTSHRCHLLSRELCFNKLTTQTDKLYANGLVMMMVASELNPILSGDKTLNLKVSRRELHLADAAKDILCQEYRNPPSIEQLAARVGTNSFKLKALFHRHFNNTPYGVLMEIRMKKAYQLLSTTGCHVSSAAYSVGYEHASNFSAAFKKYFGVSPKAIAKRS